MIDIEENVDLVKKIKKNQKESKKIKNKQTNHDDDDSGHHDNVAIVASTFKDNADVLSQTIHAPVNPQTNKQ